MSKRERRYNELIKVSTAQKCFLLILVHDDVRCATTKTNVDDDDDNTKNVERNQETFEKYKPSLLASLIGNLQRASSHCLLPQDFFCWPVGWSVGRSI